MLYWLLKYVLVGPFISVYNRPEVVGLENIPTDGPAILAGNHLSIADWLFTPLKSPRRITYLAKSDYFTTPGFKGRLMKMFFTGTGQTPIDRSNADAAQAALDTARRILDQGKLVEIYVEGTRSPDGRLYKGKTGVARLTLETGVPVIPVAVIGTDKVITEGSRLFRPAKVRVEFGAPIDFSRYQGMAGNRFVERSITDEIMYKLMQMSGQEYVDIYGSTAKRRMQAGEPIDRLDQPRQAADADRIPDTRAG
ncbi:lysophospholipid acyltransferase family protein [Skermania piniformis]|uniref:1-acyl-sn-glycerol-3-phosphate acyltransferase n=1 Tax=Skermania pinensis TaxID=39122 RepID=A0ABX8SD17_9ACTN|nr:lysophospholipid acyltransferase family protein [Skermania piniformis]QXQ15057.1 1-acyl-sn-glycerol-3-phosphate acyltransferase [Skermania piniformis]